MSTVAYLFIFVALLIFRQVYKGRVMNIGEDLSDAFIAFTTGDTAKLTAVLARTGEGNKPTASAAASSLASTAAQGLGAAVKVAAESGVAGAAIKRGTSAKGYRWAATGPDYYDCSGLVWRACQDNGFTGLRFTTATIQLAKQMQSITATDAGRNDIVVWPTGHMGVITAPGKFYSARNPKNGIGESAIEGFHSGPRNYYRLTVGMK